MCHKDRASEVTKMVLQSFYLRTFEKLAPVLWQFSHVFNNILEFWSSLINDLGYSRFLWFWSPDKIKEPGGKNVRALRKNNI